MIQKAVCILFMYAGAYARFLYAQVLLLAGTTVWFASPCGCDKTENMPFVNTFWAHQHKIVYSVRDSVMVYFEHFM